MMAQRVARVAGLIIATAIGGAALVGSGCTRLADAPQAARSSQALIGPQLSPTRQLRRVSLVLKGVEPSLAEYEALLAQSPAQQQLTLQAAIDSGLAAPEFYKVMLAFGHDWMRTSSYAFGGVNGAWWTGGQAIFLEVCPVGTAHAGAWRVPDSYLPDPCLNAAARVDQITDPWWAPGTTITTVGNAGSGIRTSNGVDCGLADNQRESTTTFLEGSTTCSCGPNLIYCYPKTYYFSSGNYFDEDGDSGREGRPRRSLWEEPARLVAHLSVNDRPLTDLVLGDTTVVNLKLQHLYQRAARQAGAVAAAQDDSQWWRSVTDPLAWREVKISEINPLLIADRNYKYDPRVEPAQALGIPSAGVLTMLGSMGAFPRERVRAARWLEILGCVNFNAPDPGVVFNDFVNDPASQGSCQHCHGAGGIDATAIHFKRVAVRESGDIVFAGIGRWTWAGLKTNGSEQRDPEPLARWTTAFLPGTALTPVTAAQVTSRPEARFIDFLGPGPTLFGQPSDGTIGPLGFAKMLVASGAFDRCVARKVYGQVFGRDLDISKEGIYLDEITRHFVAGGRQMRPYLRYLLSTEEFRSGL